jgi:hypothetical protein
MAASLSKGLLRSLGLLRLKIAAGLLCAITICVATAPAGSSFARTAPIPNPTSAPLSPKTPVVVTFFWNETPISTEKWILGNNGIALGKFNLGVHARPIRWLLDEKPNAVDPIPITLQDIQNTQAGLTDVVIKIRPTSQGHDSLFSLSGSCVVAGMSPAHIMNISAVPGGTTVGPHRFFLMEINPQGTYTTSAGYPQIYAIAPNGSVRKAVMTGLRLMHTGLVGPKTGEVTLGIAIEVAPDPKNHV